MKTKKTYTILFEMYENKQEKDNNHTSASHILYTDKTRLSEVKIEPHTPIEASLEGLVKDWNKYYKCKFDLEKIINSLQRDGDNYTYPDTSIPNELVFLRIKCNIVEDGKQHRASFFNNYK